MFLTKLKIPTLLLALGLLGAGAHVLTHGASADVTTAAVAVNDQPEAVEAAPPEGDKPRDKEKPRDGDKPREGEKPRQGDKPREKGNANLGEMAILTGTVSKEVVKRKKDDGTEIAVPLYYLTEAKGNKVLLPSPRFGEDGQLRDKVNVEEFVGKQVTLTVRAVTARTREAADAPKRVSKVLAILDAKVTK